MDEYTRGRLAGQVRQVRRHRERLLDDHDLCLTRLLPQEDVQAALERHQVRYRERLYTPLLTIWMFLYQVLASDQSCRAAVARLLAFLCVNGQGSASAKPTPTAKLASGCPSRSWPIWPATQAGSWIARLRPRVCWGAGRSRSSTAPPSACPTRQRIRRPIPQQPGQKQGLGFPILRLVGLISLSCGAVLDVAMAPYQGKLTGETTLLRQLLDHLQSGEILLADAIFANYWTIALLLERGVDLLARRDGKRRMDFRRGRRLGRYDHLVPWHKPIRPSWMSKTLYRRLPQTLSLREVQVPVTVKGFRCRRLQLVTTLLDPQLYPQPGAGGGVSLSLAGGVGFAFDQAGDADGRAAVQESRDGPQGDLDAPAGL